MNVVMYNASTTIKCLNNVYNGRRKRNAYVGLSTCYYIYTYRRRSLLSFNTRPANNRGISMETSTSN